MFQLYGEFKEYKAIFFAKYTEIWIYLGVNHLEGSMIHITDTENLTYKFGFKTFVTKHFNQSDKVSFD